MIGGRRSYQDVENFSRGTFDVFKDRGITHVLGVSRGGLIPATYVSYYFNVPMIVTNYSSERGLGWYSQDSIRILEDSKHPLDYESVVLIVDDDCDTGHTLKDLREYFAGIGIMSYTAVIQERTDSIFRPNFSLFKIDRSTSMQYPWNIDVGK